VGINADKVGKLVSEVAQASNEQSLGIGQITKATAEMDKVTQANAATAEESAGAAGQLALQADNLLHMVGEINVLAHGKGAALIQPEPDEEERPAPAAPAAPPKRKRAAGQKAPKKALPEEPEEEDDLDS